MATEKKMKDPTEAALSAIEQALNLDEGVPAGAPAGKAPAWDEEHPKLPDVEQHDFTRGPFRAMDERPAPPEEDKRAEPVDAEPAAPSVVVPDRAAVANDDRQDVGVMPRALQSRPSERPYAVAAAL